MKFLFFLSGGHRQEKNCGDRTSAALSCIIEHNFPPVSTFFFLVRAAAAAVGRKKVALIWLKIGQWIAYG